MNTTRTGFILTLSITLTFILRLGLCSTCPPPRTFCPPQMLLLSSSLAWPHLRPQMCPKATFVSTFIATPITRCTPRMFFQASSNRDPNANRNPNPNPDPNANPNPNPNRLKRSHVGMDQDVGRYIKGRNSHNTWDHTTDAGVKNNYHNSVNLIHSIILWFLTLSDVETLPS